MQGAHHNVLRNIYSEGEIFVDGDDNYFENIYASRFQAPGRRNIYRNIREIKRK